VPDFTVDDVQNALSQLKGTGLFGDRQLKAVPVTELADAIAKTHGRPNAADLDEAVISLGGKRNEYLDPWSWPWDRLKRFAGIPERTRDLYLVPTSLVR
jgi:hypothetical protein